MFGQVLVVAGVSVEATQETTSGLGDVGGGWVCAAELLDRNPIVERHDREELDLLPVRSMSSPPIAWSYSLTILTTDVGDWW